MSDEPLETHMEAHTGKPSAVALVLREAANMLDDMPDDMRLSFELDVWEEVDHD